MTSNQGCGPVAARQELHGFVLRNPQIQAPKMHPKSQRALYPDEVLPASSQVLRISKVPDKAQFLV